MHSIPVADWPEPDRCAWESACRPGSRLKHGGPAAHLKPISRADLAGRYGYSLDHFGRTGMPLSNGEPAGQVTPEHVPAYIGNCTSAFPR